MLNLMGLGYICEEGEHELTAAQRSFLDGVTRPELHMDIYLRMTGQPDYQSPEKQIVPNREMD